jgi:hypothetical protein
MEEVFRKMIDKINALPIREKEAFPVSEPKLEISGNSIVVDCKCGKWLFVK